jgi:hypothetical protein
VCQPVADVITGEKLSTPMETVNFITDIGTILKQTWQPKSANDCRQPEG